MTFFEILQLFKQGKKIRRSHWCSYWFLDHGHIWCDKYHEGKYCLSNSDNVDLMKLLEDVSSGDWQYFDEQSEEWKDRVSVVKPSGTVIVTDSELLCRRCGKVVFRHCGDLCASCWDEVCRK